ncbi:NTP transferase domain-containing protein [Patescibacteria group bacterium]|nr:NTP transferase domain-containing protein [Patescibacteria group bacterium]
MSGAGSRFAKEDYQLPKPLIPVSGRPMILRVIEALPPADKWIFIVRNEHITHYEIEDIIRQATPNAIIVPDPNPHGQATSCLLALPHLSPEDNIFIAACDNSFLFDRQRFLKLTQRPDVDAIIWTFTKDELLTAQPEAWGWVKLATDGETITDMSVKIPVSQNPLDDHAVVGAFYFKKTKQFAEAGNLMIKEKYQTNGEYYLDALPIFYNRLGWKSIIFDVELYVGWGKPADLHKYEEQERQYQLGAFAKTNDPQDHLWVKFFDTNLK